MVLAMKIDALACVMSNVYKVLLQYRTNFKNKFSTSEQVKRFNNGYINTRQ